MKILKNDYRKLLGKRIGPYIIVEIGESPGFLPCDWDKPTRCSDCQMEGRRVLVRYEESEHNPNFPFPRYTRCFPTLLQDRSLWNREKKGELKKDED